MIGSYHTTAEYVYLPPDQVSTIHEIKKIIVLGTIYLFKNIETVAFVFKDFLKLS
jgi:hypothetical protein